jgi:hypothetical protein
MSLASAIKIDHQRLPSSPHGHCVVFNASIIANRQAA